MSFDVSHLQEYLRQAEECDPGHPAARTPYHFCFYLRDALPGAEGIRESTFITI